MNKLKISLLVVIALLFSCVEDTDTSTTDTNTLNNTNALTSSSNTNTVATGTNCATSTTNAIAYLNCFRGLTGMSGLSVNSQLQTATLKHAMYLNTNNSSGHGETIGNPDFYAATPNARVAKAGFKSSVIENVSTHSEATYKDSIEGLMGAIYHRFGFLNTDMDLIGAGENQSDSSKVKGFVYKLANNAANNLCNGTAFTEPGSIRYACLDSLGAFDNNQGISDTSYQSALSTVGNSNPSIIKWPAENNIDVVPVFNVESPHPTTGYSVSGYPVSVEFNQYKFSSPPSISSFTLSKVGAVGNLSVITIMNKDNDPNSTFNAYQHALFPTQRLDWASEYKVDVSYNDGTAKTLSWNFTTRNLGVTLHTVTGSNPVLNGVLSGKTFAVYVPPRNKTDSALSYSTSVPSSMALDVKIFDSNTLKVTATGTGTATIIYHGSNITFTI